MENRSNRKQVQVVVLVFVMIAICLGYILCLAEENLTAEVSPIGKTAEGGISPEAAAEGYIYRAFQMSGYGPRRGVTARSKLESEKELWFYDELKAEIKKVADGEEESTQFTFPMKNVFDNPGYTAEELGVDSLIDGNAINAEAKNAFGTIMSASVYRVLDALVYDCAYELYWFDKTTPYGMSGFGISFSEDKLYLSNYENATVTVKFPVAAGYSETRETGTYCFDTALGQAVQTAVDNAQQVVSGNSGKSDYAKLKAYNDWICDHVDYNYDALADDVLYGDPWQLVWVFDGNTETDVVCEGYSKAFQYLCDESDFTGSVSAYCVTGFMSGGTGAGDHMWNLVNMNGTRYLVDVTNCDDNSVGAPDRLFMAGYSEEYKIPNEDRWGYIYEVNDGSEVSYLYDAETIGLYSEEELTVSDSDYTEDTLLNFEEPDVQINNQYDPDEEILISVQWPEGAETLSISIKDEHGGTPYDWEMPSWTAETKPDDGNCQFLINVNNDDHDWRMVEGEYVAVIELEGTGYNKGSFSYSFEITEGSLPDLTLDAPEELAIGQDLQIGVEGKEQDAWLQVSVLQGEEELGTFRVESEGFSGYALISESYFETAGSYEVHICQQSQRNWGVKKSAEAVVTVTVTGNRPAVPSVEIPEGTFYDTDTIWIRVIAEGAESVCCEYDGRRKEFVVTNGEASVPLSLVKSTEVVFRAGINGVWSPRTQVYTIVVEHRGPGMTVPATSLCGQDVEVTGITPVEGAGLYTFSLGYNYQEEDSQEYGLTISDQIIYDQPVDISGGSFVIPGCNFMEAGKYSVTVSAYVDGSGDWLGETTRAVNVTLNPDLPAAPQVELLTETNLMYGVSQFRVEAVGGAEKIYAFISREDDWGLDANPLIMETNPNETSYLCEWTNRNTGVMIAYFTVYRNNTWSAASTPIRYSVDSPDDDKELASPQITCPRDAALGNSFTVSWKAVKKAQWYEASLMMGTRVLQKQRVNSGETLSVTFDTDDLRSSGCYVVKLRAYAAGYWPGYADDPEIELLDPGLAMTASLEVVNGGEATINLTGVATDRLRIRIDGRNAGEIPVEPGSACDSITVHTGTGRHIVQVSNYGTDPSEWGTWSNEVVVPNLDEVFTTINVLRLPADLEVVRTGAFENVDCEAVYIPDGCRIIEAGAFLNCEKLKYVSCPRGIEILNGAFEGCSESLLIVYR